SIPGLGPGLAGGGGPGPPLGGAPPALLGGGVPGGGGGGGGGDRGIEGRVVLRLDPALLLKVGRIEGRLFGDLCYHPAEYC
ncbi:MAG: hypothetical protein MPL62_17705, partial [Alphaproteobacteria bacterium]|nr:hypothetical protein [Alphaproteobacteria bacterium]